MAINNQVDIDEVYMSIDRAMAVNDLLFELANRDDALQALQAGSLSGAFDSIQKHLSHAQSLIVGSAKRDS